MITAREIIFLWVSRMMMLGLHFVGRMPFTNVFITPLVFDLQGRKMSKSLGNAIDPMDLVEKYGADGFRFGMLRQMRLESQELRFDEGKVRRGAPLQQQTVERAALDRVARRRVARPHRAAAGRPADAGRSLDPHQAARDGRGRHRRRYDAFEMGVAADALVQFGW